MEISDPVPEMIIPVTAGKRRLELRVRTRAECRELIRVAALAAEKLPEDGDGGLVPSDTVKRMSPVAGPSMTLVAIMEALAPMNRSQLRAVIVDAWGWQAAGVEQAISDVQARSAEARCPAVAPHSLKACALPPGHDGHHESAARPAIVWGPGVDDGEPVLTCRRCKAAPALADDVICAACERAEAVYAAREQADPGYLEDAAAQDDDGADRLARGELAAAEVDEARSRERRSDSAVGPLAEEEPDEDDEEYTGESIHADPPHACLSGTREIKGEPRACGNVPAHLGRHYFEQRGERWEWDNNGRLFGPFYPHAVAAPSVSDEVRAGMLAEMRSRPGYPHGGGRAQTAAQRALDEQQADAAIGANEFNATYYGVAAPVFPAGNDAEVPA